MGVDDACGDFDSGLQDRSRDLVAVLAVDVEMYAAEPCNMTPEEMDALRRGIKAVEDGEPYALTRLMNLANAIDLSHNVFPQIGCAEMYFVMVREKLAAAIAAIVAAEAFNATHETTG